MPSSSLAKKAHVHGETSLVTKDEAAKILGISVSAVNKKFSAMNIEPMKVGPHGRLFYDLTVVETIRTTSYKLRRAANGFIDTELNIDVETQGLVFTCLNKGIDPIQIVIEEKVPHNVVEKLISVWERMTGNVTLSMHQQESIADAIYIDLPKDREHRNRIFYETVLTALKDGMDSKVKCLSCGERDPVFCMVCKNAATEEKQPKPKPTLQPRTPQAKTAGDAR